MNGMDIFGIIVGCLAFCFISCCCCVYYGQLKDKWDFEEARLRGHPKWSDTDEQGRRVMRTRGGTTIVDDTPEGRKRAQVVNIDKIAEVQTQTQTITQPPRQEYTQSFPQSYPQSNPPLSYPQGYPHSYPPSYPESYLQSNAQVSNFKQFRDTTESEFRPIATVQTPERMARPTKASRLPPLMNAPRAPPVDDEESPAFDIDKYERETYNTPQFKRLYERELNRLREQQERELGRFV